MYNSASKINLGLYIHWPFCQKKCPYCDFNSHVSSGHDDEEFGSALCQEMNHMATLIPEKRALTSLFFGGGTPSLMSPEVLSKIISHAEKTFGFMPTTEISIEANPTSVEAAAMTEFLHAGVNRVSMGLQSLDDKTLKFLGREHTVFEALSALQMIRKNFANVSLDLIYGTVGETPASWNSQLLQVLDLDMPHLSLYQLVVERGTSFYTRQRNGEQLNLNDDLAADLYELTQKLTSDAGLSAYEISNHTKPGMECQHNLNYWQAGDWLGIGPGAHGRFCINFHNYTDLRRIGTETLHSPKGWLESVKKRGHGISLQTTDCAADYATEMMMMGLRLSDGVKIKNIETACGPKDGWLNKSAMATAIEAGWLKLEKSNQKNREARLRITETGRLRLNQILSMILY